MTPRENYVAYFKDLARRNVDIAHELSPDSARRFWVEGDEDVTPLNNAGANTGWNLLLMPFHGGAADKAKGGNLGLVPRAVFQVLKHCQPQDEAAIDAAINQAWTIAWELITKIEEHVELCIMGQDVAITDLSAGIAHPRNIDRGSIRYAEVGPRFDHFYGYEFSVDLLIDRDVPATPNPAKWRSI